MKSLEIETKYNADAIDLTAFHAFCKDRGEHRYIFASGYDHFFQSKEDDDAFCRHRIGPDMNQLTFKRKLAASNNFIRTEHNLTLAETAGEDVVQSLCSEFGYAYNTSIFKNCFVYVYSEYTLVYYVCYDLNLKEIGRFVEIEMSEEREWASQDDAWKQLMVLEKLCKPLGLTSQGRIRRSLYEMFKKGTK
jgi:adenylate cyclase class IV